MENHAIVMVEVMGNTRESNKVRYLGSFDSLTLTFERITQTVATAVGFTNSMINSCFKQ